MLTTLALYAVSAVLFTSTPTNPGHDPQAGGPGNAPAVSPSDQGTGSAMTAGEASQDPGQALAHAPRPSTLGDEGTSRALTAGRAAAPASVAGSGAEAGPTDESLFQQRTWTGP
jgi:hypothetical protein